MKSIAAGPLRSQGSQLKANRFSCESCFEALTQWAKRDTLMLQGKNCRETIFVSQLSRSYPRRRGNFERGKNALSCGRGNCESKIVARQWGVNFCRETSRCLAGPFGQTSSQPLGAPPHRPTSSTSSSSLNKPPHTPRFLLEPTPSLWPREHGSICPFGFFSRI